MADPIDADLKRRTEALLEPGEVELNGLIVHTEFSRDDELRMHETLLDVGEIIATHAGEDDWYVYAGNDDPEFASNQHQGLTVGDDVFVWECQQLLRDGTFDIVFYYRASADHEAIITAVEAAGHTVTGVTG